MRNILKVTNQLIFLVSDLKKGTKFEYKDHHPKLVHQEL
jgi:hypothetical protein